MHTARLRRSSARRYPPGPRTETRDGDRGLLTWALSGRAAAEQRMAELEARLAYLESLTVTDELT